MILAHIARIPRLAGHDRNRRRDYNLKAAPRIKEEVDTQTFTVLAQELHDTPRAELWPKLVTQYPQLGEVQAKTTRQIPVFMLTRLD